MARTLHESYSFCHAEAADVSFLAGQCFCSLPLCRQPCVNIQTIFLIDFDKVGCHSLFDISVIVRELCSIFVPHDDVTGISGEYNFESISTKDGPIRYLVGICSLHTC